MRDAGAVEHENPSERYRIIGFFLDDFDADRIESLRSRREVDVVSLRLSNPPTIEVSLPPGATQAAVQAITAQIAELRPSEIRIDRLSVNSSPDPAKPEGQHPADRPEVRYQELRPGDRFKFDYPHHGEAPFQPVWRKLEVGYERDDGSEWRPDLPARSPIPLERVPPA